MKIALSWLKELIELDQPVEDIAAMLTASGLEVEGIQHYEQIPGGLNGLVVGEVITCEQHPGADRLKKTQVNVGGVQPLSIICGAPNVQKGQKVIVAPVGTTLYPESGEPFKIKKAKIRGELSEGMICAEDEIGLGHDHDGIIELNDSEPVGKLAAEVYHMQADPIIEIGLTPNRGDAASHLGVARDLKAILNTEIKFPKCLDKNGLAAKNPYQIQIENEDACPQYCGLLIEGVQVESSPDWLKHRLQSIGLAPINNVVDATNYVLHELGQPLHAFDADQIQGETIFIQSYQGHKFKALDGKQYELQDSDIMIGDAKGPMCMAGIIGGPDSGITDQTTRIFLECAYFSADYIRKSATKHGIKTDASFRYERGTDPEILHQALLRAAFIISEVAGGKVVSAIMEQHPKPISHQKIKVKYRNIDRLIGVAIPKEQIHAILTLLDIKLEEDSLESFVADVPPYRCDVTREADIIEEILRIYGYDRIPLSKVLNTSYISTFPEPYPVDMQYEITQFLAARGMKEIITNSLTHERILNTISEYNSDRSVQILNRLSEDHHVLRQNLLPSGLEVLSYNIKHKQSHLSLFEFGTIYATQDNKYVEENKLALYLTEQRSSSWNEVQGNNQFHDMLATFNLILQKLNWGKDSSAMIMQEFEASDYFEFGISFRHKNTGVEWGKVAHVATKLLSAYKIEQPIFYAELAWDKGLELNLKNKGVYQPISKYPAVNRDLSLVIDRHVTYQQIEEVTRKVERKLIKQIQLFDVYIGEKIAENKKAYALHFVLQDEQGTFTDKKIDKLMNKLIHAFEKELGALIRT